jgi:hypothetical protein
MEKENMESAEAKSESVIKEKMKKKTISNRLIFVL